MALSLRWRSASDPGFVSRAALKQLPLPARMYVAAVIVAGAALLLFRLPDATFAQPYLFVTLVGLSTLSAALKVTLPLTSSVSTMSVSYALDFASLLLIGPHETMVVAAASAWGQCHLNSKERNPIHRTLFSMASLVVTVEVAGTTFRLLQAPDADPVTAVARPLVGAAFAYYMANTGLVAAAVALSSGEPIVSTWHRNFLWSAPSYFVGAGSAALAAWAVRTVGFWVAPLTFAPIFLTYHTYKVYMGRLDAQRHVQETSNLHQATIEALAGAIDAKDQMTNAHIFRVQFYAVGLAKAVGLEALDIEAVKTAALLHDIGKLAVPEHILSKPGPLTPEEFQKVRIHSQVGSEIIAGVPFPRPVAPLILSHHERWDGTGYPQGLVGEVIPIGARILTLVDYYDAITSERPYHKALSPENAVRLIQHEAGRALDPALVEVFVKLLPSLVARCEAALPTSRRTAETPATDRTAPVLDPRAAAFENINLAHREIYALYEVAQSMGTSQGVADTMTLISSKLSKLVPWSGCALLLRQHGSELLQCRYAAGTNAPLLLHKTIGLGEGLSGWVARNRRILVNASPRAEFEAAGVVSDITLHSAIVCPLMVGDAFIGSLALFHTVANHYTDDHRRLMASVAEQAGAVIHNSTVFDRTQEDSLTDPLTSLPNRRTLFARLTHELARAARLRKELALVVIDLDDFKSINDRFGHHVGDQALRTVATELRRALRPYDLCVRFAGDEFVILMSDTGRETAEAKVRIMQEHIGGFDIEGFAGRRVSLSASAGVAVSPRDGTTYETLLADADRRMYLDKAARRAAACDSIQAQWIPATAGGEMALPYTARGIRYEA